MGSGWSIRKGLGPVGAVTTSWGPDSWLGNITQLWICLGGRLSRLMHKVLSGLLQGSHPWGLELGRGSGWRFCRCSLPSRGQGGKTSPWCDC